MNKSIAARQKGDDYQAWFFWDRACRLLWQNTNILKVGYEFPDIKSIDDVVVFYQNPERDCRGNSIETDYYQLKFHVDYSGAFTLDSLMDPRFIHAKSNTILKSVANAIKKHKKDSTKIRLYYVSPWEVAHDDILSELISPTEGEVRIDILFNDKPSSKILELREKMKKHIGVKSNDELKQILLPLRLIRSGAQKELNESLDMSLINASLVPVDRTRDSNVYFDLIRTWHKKGICKFEKALLLSLCEQEHLVAKNKTEYINAAIRSYSNRAAKIDSEHTLDLTNCFSGRILKNGLGWNNSVLPLINEFANQHFEQGKRYRLYLDTHYPIAFSIGRQLDTKSGVVVYPMQKTIEGYTPWTISNEIGSSEPLLNSTNCILDTCNTDVALAIGFTHDILGDVKYYLRKSELSVNRVINCEAQLSPTNNVIKNGIHAVILAREISQKLATRTTEEKKATLHIFIAAPIAFVFMLGQLSNSFGKCIVYEHDFEQQNDWIYTPSISF